MLSPAGLGGALCALFLAQLTAAAADAVPSVRVKAAGDGTHVEVAATLPRTVADSFPAGTIPASQAEGLLQFAYVDPHSKKPGPAIFGSYIRQGAMLVFRPRYPLVRGQSYQARLVLPGEPPRTASYTVPKPPAGPPTVVERVYPTTDVLPCNTLKFYIHFSRPMRETSEVFDHINLLDDHGKPVHDPWRRTELWTPDSRRLTLWFHPGRVKHGVNLREEIGPVLEPDRSYTLVIDADLLDENGAALGKPFIKKFRTTPNERSRPLPERWQVEAPKAGTPAPLVVRFPKPLDRWLVEKYLSVRDADGKPVEGQVEVGTEEKSWLFHPKQPWRAADYTLTVNDRLEDLAGNTPVRVFDTDLEEPEPKPPALGRKFTPR